MEVVVGVRFADIEFGGCRGVFRPEETGSLRLENLDFWVRGKRPRCTLNCPGEPTMEILELTIPDYPKEPI